MNLPNSLCGRRFRFSFLAVLSLGFGIVVSLLMNAPGVQAQALSGIQGTVTDEAGGVVPPATVGGKKNGTGVAQRTTTSSVGSYTITDLIPGTYTVKIEKQGFNTWQSANVVVEAGGKQATADAT